jgi:hypothetical protein
MGIAKQRTNLSLFGRLAADPDLTILKNDKIKVEFFLYYNAGPRYESPNLEFVTFNAPLVEYIVENFHKGDLMYVTESSPMARGRGKIRKSQPNYKWICWNIALKGTEELNDDRTFLYADTSDQS